MLNPARRAVALALLAAAIVAGAIALDLPSAAAQSDDEQAGRIVARRLDDGRTEFGWQPAGTARVLPSLRYFPADAQVDRWLNSSPVEVEGEAIGRINARLLDDGRIEFAFTPTDGERILTDARYFPVDARPNRWLRSTEITISAAPAAGFVAISGACAIRAGSGAIECWDYGWTRVNPETGEREEIDRIDPPAGRFTAVAVGYSHACAIRAGSGAIECWGKNIWDRWNPDTEEREEINTGQTDAPAGSFTAVAVGSRHTCAIRDTGELACWGSNEWTEPGNIYNAGQATPPAGRFTAVSASGGYNCAIRESDSAIECWGGGFWVETPAGSFSAVSTGFQHACAIHAVSGAIECWGYDWNLMVQRTPQAGSFTAVSTGQSHTCAIRAESGAIECWGYYGERWNPDTGEREEIRSAPPPAGSFSAVSAGGGYTYAIRAESGAIECWGVRCELPTAAPAP